MGTEPFLLVQLLQVTWVPGHHLSMCLVMVQSNLASSLNCQQSFQASSLQEAACEEWHTAEPLLQKASPVRTLMHSSLTLLHVVWESGCEGPSVPFLPEYP